MPEQGERAGTMRKIGGWALVVVGVAGLVLPVIPGVPLLIGGLAILAPDYVWAQKSLDKVKGWAARVRGKEAGAK